MDMTDSYIIAAIITVSVFLVWFYIRGARKWNALAQAEQEIVSSDRDAVIVKGIAYHGGFPAIPKPTRLTLGLCREGVTLSSIDGRQGNIPFADFHKIDKFSTLRKQGKRQSMFFWAPVALLFVREKTRHFVTIKYTDVDRDINHVVLETKDETELDRLYRFLDQGWHGFKAYRPV